MSEKLSPQSGGESESSDYRRKIAELGENMDRPLSDFAPKLAILKERDKIAGDLLDTLLKREDECECTDDYICIKCLVSVAIGDRSSVEIVLRLLDTHRPEQEGSAMYRECLSCGVVSVVTGSILDDIQAFVDKHRDQSSSKQPVAPDQAGSDEVIRPCIEFTGDGPMSEETAQKLKEDIEEIRKRSKESHKPVDRNIMIGESGQPDQAGLDEIVDEADKTIALLYVHTEDQPSTEEIILKAKRAIRQACIAHAAERDALLEECRKLLSRCSNRIAHDADCDPNVGNCLCGINGIEDRILGLLAKLPAENETQTDDRIDKEKE